MKKYLITTRKNNRDVNKLISENINLCDVEVVEAFDDLQPHISLYKTIIYLLEINIGKPIIIFEDDVKFQPTFSYEKLDKIAKDFFGKVDIISTGVFESNGEFNCWGYFDRFNLDKFKGNQGTVYLPTALFKLKNVKPFHIDLILAKHCKCICTFPFMTYQKSDNESKISGVKNMSDYYENQEIKIKKELNL